MTKVFIASACRTPIGNFNGQFEKYSAVELGTIAVSEALIRANVEPEDIDECILGQVLTAGQGQNPARQVSINAKIPNKAPAYTVNMLCGSGLKAIALGYQAIRNGDSGLLVAGGQESMTRAQHSTYLRGTKMGALNLSDTMVIDGLTDAFNNTSMGNTAEFLATNHGISRSVQDEFALKSQTKAAEAMKNGYFEKEIIGVPDKRTKALIVKDEFPKLDSTIEKLGKFRAAFQSNGTVTAGNSSGINDGAAALVLASEEKVKQKNINAIAEIIAYAESGIEPMSMGLAPIGAVEKVLKKANWTKEEVELYELNEAFAVQSVICSSKLGLDPNKVNVAGGAIALGHPIGASGARCLVTLIYNLKRLGKHKGVVSLCIGGGMSNAMAIQIC